MPRKSISEILIYLTVIALALVALALAVSSPRFLSDNLAVYQGF
ncbi:MAG: hypothetical protein ABSC89_09770 [Verrucomicrobiota bacterium]|jgi:hypothetical protein